MRSQKQFLEFPFWSVEEVYGLWRWICGRRVLRKRKEGGDYKGGKNTAQKRAEKNERKPKDEAVESGKRSPHSPCPPAHHVGNLLVCICFP